MAVYIGGPVMGGRKSHGGEPWSDEVYTLIQRVARRVGADVVLPFFDRQIDDLVPNSFFDEIKDRIRSSDAVIILLASDDAAGPVEATIAAAHDRRQMAIAEIEPSVHRLIRGMPGVEEVVDRRDPQLADKIARFIDPRNTQRRLSRTFFG